jgi:2,4-dienoyl-CoA reductase-like NADH-dependent reductase (Old Yellow Enzyme family)
MAQLFVPLPLRSVTFRNRIWVSPMCQYSSDSGLPNDWHFVHLGGFATGGAGLVMVEASGVSPEGRITDWDSGIWSPAHAEAFRRIVAFVEEQGAVAGIQLAHAGRKASTEVPWRGGKPIVEGPHAWQPLAPSALAFRPGDSVPRAMTKADIEKTIADFAQAARYAREAGFRVVEIHAAHGYLIHEFLSPLSNQREDEYGGSRENRMRFALDVARVVRDVWPAELPLFVRISATDWAEGGWGLDDSVDLATRLRDLGVDLIDCSSGGLVPHAKIAIGPGYQVPFARAIREGARIATAAVGMITEAGQAEEIVASGAADAVFLARQMLRDPHFALTAARALGVDGPWPVQYERAR